MVSAEIAVVIIPHSPNPAPSDFYLFPKLTEHLLVNASQRMKATGYEEGIHKLVPMHDKCLNVKDDYLER